MKRTPTPETASLPACAGMTERGRRNDEMAGEARMYGHAPYGDGAIRRLLALLPQQAIVPSVLMPQVCSPPALTAV